MVMKRQNVQQLHVQHQWRGRWLIVAALAVLAVGLMVEVARSLADNGPQVPQAAGSADGAILAVTGQISRDSYGIYLVDLSNRTICVYQYQTSQKMLKLLAARTFAYDTQLDEYNSEPSPRQIKQMVTAHRRLTDEPAGPPRPTGTIELTQPDQPGAGPGE